MKLESDSGRWRRGMVYVPPEGPCAGHWVEVLNPQVSIFKEAIAREGGEPGDDPVLVELNVHIDCVMVRCRDCKRSWSFPELAVLDGAQLVYDPADDD